MYEEEYGIAGGEPFGLLIGNYEFRNSPADLDILGRISGLAAAAFAPLVAGADPAMFGIPHFGLLERVRNLGARFNSLQFTKWNALRAERRMRASWDWSCRTC